MLGARVRPKRGHTSGSLAAQNCNWIAQVFIQKDVMFDHGGEAGLVDDRCTKATERVLVPAAPFYELKRCGGVEERPRGFHFQPEPAAQLLDRLRAFPEDRKKIKADAG